MCVDELHLLERSQSISHRAIRHATQRLQNGERIQTRQTEVQRGENRVQTSEVQQPGVGFDEITRADLMVSRFDGDDRRMRHGQASARTRQS